MRMACWRADSSLRIVSSCVQPDGYQERTIREAGASDDINGYDQLSVVKVHKGYDQLSYRTQRSAVVSPLRFTLYVFAFHTLVLDGHRPHTDIDDQCDRVVRRSEALGL